MKLEILMKRHLLSNSCLYISPEDENETQLSEKHIPGPFKRIINTALAFGLGLVSAAPETLITLIPSTALLKLPIYSPLKNTLFIITTFTLYPLVYETLHIMKQPGYCNDIDFCGGWIETIFENFYSNLEKTVQNLSQDTENTTNTHTLPIFNPKSVYDQARSVAYTLYTSIIGSHIGIKLSAPHLEIIPHEV